MAADLTKPPMLYTRYDAETDTIAVYAGHGALAEAVPMLTLAPDGAAWLACSLRRQLDRRPQHMTVDEARRLLGLAPEEDA